MKRNENNLQIHKLCPLLIIFGDSIVQYSLEMELNHKNHSEKSQFLYGILFIFDIIASCQRSSVNCKVLDYFYNYLLYLSVPAKNQQKFSTRDHLLPPKFYGLPEG